MWSPTMRTAVAAVATGLAAAGLVSPVVAQHETGVTPKVTLVAEITKGNGDVESANVDPAAAGEWHVVADVSGTVDEVFVQLWRPEGGLCAGELIVEETLSGSDAKPYHRRHVEPGTYDLTLTSTVDDEHCVRVILWGSRGAKAVVDAYEPAPADPATLLPVLSGT